MERVARMAVGERARGEGREAALALLRDGRPWVYRLALAIVGRPEVGEDVAQDALLRLWRAQDRLARADDPRAFARRVIVNRALTALRRERTEPLSPDHPAAPDSTADVRAVLDRLQPEDRALLALVGFEGATYAEAAEALGVPEGTVASRLHRARAAFRREWEA